ncbi:MAG: hypothetical protein K5622_05440 [Endomicrobiaceae bacterium]|nr:hypothetical protein [Endomicrobiaceae bacterium]
MEKEKQKNKSFEIGFYSFLLAFLCPPLWIFLYLICMLNADDDNDKK